MKIRNFLPWVAVLAASSAWGQPSDRGPLAPPANGPRRSDPTYMALTNATVHSVPGTVLRRATVVFRDGVIRAVLPSAPGPDGVAGTADDVPPPLPLGPRVIDCTGLHLFPAFIDPFVEVDAPAPAGSPAALHWNPNVTPQRRALDGAGIGDAANALRRQGFGAAAISPRGGVIRGQAAVVSLARPADDASAARPPVYRDRVYQTFSFETSGSGYPDSQMGAIALVRQSLGDVAWQAARRADGTLTDPTNALDSLIPVTDATPAAGATGIPPRAGLLAFDASTELESLRAAEVAAEFGRSMLILGTGTEYRRLNAFVTFRHPLVIPLNFPRPPSVATVGQQQDVELATLMAWEQAPTNPRRLEQAGLTFALTATGLRDKGDFLRQVRTAIRHGLSPRRALEALTITPAQLLGVEGQLGTIEAGKRANIIIADGDLLDDAATPTARVRSIVIDGFNHEVHLPEMKLEGVWDLAIPAAAPMPRRLVVVGENEITIHRGDKSTRATRVDIMGGRLSFTFDHEPLGDFTGIYTMTAAILPGSDGKPGRLTGVGLRPTGEEFDFSAERRPDSPFLGQWRVTSADGAAIALPKPEDRTKEGVELTITQEEVTLTFHGVVLPKPDAKPEDEAPKPKTVTIKAEGVKLEGAVLTYTYDQKALGREGVVSDRLEVKDGLVSGVSTFPGGQTHRFEARLFPKDPPKDEKRERDLEVIAAIPQQIPTPFSPYGRMSPAPVEHVILTNGTIWTQTQTGIIEGGEIELKDGKVVYVGRARRHEAVTGGPEIIDLNGRHVTPGIIDCHSHTGISAGVNEGGQAITAEVRIQDVTNPDDVNWYRQLASGVTAVNNLHGSANAIGGQSQTNKLRWGAPLPSDMHMEGAFPGIKFALGENPTQVNWGLRERSRYPQTRMGVEQLIRDRFVAAQAYADQFGGLDAFRHTSGVRSVDGPHPDYTRFPARRDLELEALAQVLAGSRLIHCHSYRQDEIVMLTHVARDYKFRIGTFQHVLEGYKVAPEIRAHAIGASAFSDWWAFKVEVQDAIPYGPPLMEEVGVVVSYNSDSNELARRMNTEATKAVRYSFGRLAPQAALDFVTRNPAIQLGVESRIGSLAQGMDADVAVWSGDPLSTYTRCEMTFVDGRRLFSLEQDAQSNAWIAAERERLIQKILDENRRRPAAPASESTPGMPAAPGRDVIDTRPPTGLEHLSAAQRAALQRHLMDTLAAGKDPYYAPGLCGCGFPHF